MKTDMSLVEKLKALTDKLVRTAQDSYERWSDREGFGACGHIAHAFSNVLLLHDGSLQCVVKDWGRFEDPGHSTLWVTCGEEMVEIDLPWDLYESFGPHKGSWLGVGWTKKHGVAFKADDIVIRTIDRSYQYQAKAGNLNSAA